MAPLDALISRLLSLGLEMATWPFTTEAPWGNTGAPHAAALKATWIATAMADTGRCPFIFDGRIALDSLNVAP
jgi:hypothetical protein